MKLNILVFPCGSEIGLEIHRSLRYSIHINLFGASSVKDHGLFVFDNYIDNIPFYTEDNFIEELSLIVEKYDIDAIYPTMDSVIKVLTHHEEDLRCKIIASPKDTTRICSSKALTYGHFENIVKVPRIYSATERNLSFPLFVKPDQGYGSRGAKKITSLLQLKEYLIEHKNSIICEYLPGSEYTVDCFTNRHGNLLFSGPRQRVRTMNGISVNTRPVKEGVEEFNLLAQAINSNITFRGAWFFQCKRDIDGNLTLLEIASRFGGSSSLHRNIGINFALLSVFDMFNIDVNVFTNNYNIELDRALTNRYKASIYFDIAYIDFDDCLILKDKEVNTALIRLIYQFFNSNVKLVLLTKHEKDIDESLQKYRLEGIFDKIIKIDRLEKKSSYITEESAIFIDDSFSERYDVHINCKIPVFAPDNIELLLKN